MLFYLLQLLQVLVEYDSSATTIKNRLSFANISKIDFFAAGGLYFIEGDVSITHEPITMTTTSPCFNFPPSTNLMKKKKNKNTKNKNKVVKNKVEKNDKIQNKKGNKTEKKNEISKKKKHTHTQNNIK
jgi:hypothetical protein